MNEYALVDGVLFCSQELNSTFGMSLVRAVQESSGSQIVSVYLYETILTNNARIDKGMHPKQRKRKNLASQSNGPFTQAIFVAATRCNFCRAKAATSKSHV